uniref:Integrase catalytic domain-containing protein n=1 Tax=Kryptolebias marmoratus TaxID=37003 RepID=A0A3Q2ZCY6_KRYMA
MREVHGPLHLEERNQIGIPNKLRQKIFSFLSKISYISGFSRGQRQTLRKFASKFTGNLFFGALPHRRAIRTKEEAWNLFKELHTSPIGGHTGIVKTRNAMYIEKWSVIKLKNNNSNIFKTLDCVWELVGIDLTGPLPLTSSGYQYILTATDYFSKWVEAFPLKNKSAEEVCKNLCDIIYRHGCPDRILTDQGREFVNQYSLWKHVKLTVLSRALRKLINDRQDDWDQYLDATLFSLRSKVHTTTKFTPFNLMYGREAKFPSEVPVEMPVRFCLS